MGPVPDPRRGVVELARLLLRRRDELGERRVGQRGPDQQDRRQIGQMDDRCEGGLRIVGGLRHQHVRDGIGPDVGEEQRVAIRLLARHRGCGDRADASGPVLHDQRLAVGELAEAVRQSARQRVGYTARADRHQQANRTVRPLCCRLGKRGHGGERKNGGKDGWSDNSPARTAVEWHGCPPRVIQSLLPKW